MPSGKDYADRLQEETRRTLAAHVHGFEQELQTIQTGLTAAGARVAQLLAAILEVEVPAAAEILADAIAETAQEGARGRAGEMLGLAHFAHDMRLKETQEEILHSLLDRAHRYAPRLVLFVVRGNQFIGWSSRGFAVETAQSLSSCAFAITESPLLSSALDADGLTTANDLLQEETLSHLVSGAMESPLHAFPMKAIGRPVAILLASPTGGRNCDLESLCILMDITGLCVENLALKILQEAKRAKPPATGPSTRQEVEEPVVKPATSAIESVSECVAAEAPPVAETKVLISDSPPLVEAPEAAPEPEPGVESRPADTDAPTESIGQVQEAPQNLDAAESTEARESTAAAEPEREESGGTLPADEPEGALAEATNEEVVAPAPETPEPVRPAPLREVQPLSDEERLHAEAKRFARLLASEIKLYNEQRVLEGRANRDIYVRLKRDIDRSRDMYEKRISPLVSRKVDYFHDEIIRVLGDNDPATLGSDYPGPRVES